MTRTTSVSDNWNDGFGKEAREAGESGIMMGAETGRWPEVGLGGGVHATSRYAIVAVVEVLRSVLVSRVVVVRVIESIMVLGLSLTCAMIAGWYEMIGRM